MGELLDDLRDLIADRQVIVIAGAGVSIAASGGDRCASWTGLLHSGATRCEELKLNLSDGWGDRVRGDIDSGDLDDMLPAAASTAVGCATPWAFSPSTPPKSSAPSLA